MTDHYDRQLHSLCPACEANLAEHHEGPAGSVSVPVAALEQIVAAIDPNRQADGVELAAYHHRELAAVLELLQEGPGGNVAAARRLSAVPDAPLVEGLGGDAEETDEGPAIDTSQEIVTLDGVLLALAATVMKLTDEVLVSSAANVIDSGAPDARPVVERVQAQVELGERLNGCAASARSGGGYDTTPGERNMIRRACHLLLSAQWEEPTGIPEQVLRTLGVEMEAEAWGS
jgi:hypothetical protein